MKKNVVVYVDEKTALVTKTFKKNACIFGTDEFKLWREYKAMFPDDMNMLSEEDIFIYGFRMGARMILDVVGDHKGQFYEIGEAG